MPIQIATKTKIQTHQVVLMGILLFCSGVVIGSFLLNIAASLSPKLDSGSGGWQYVYGPDKCAMQDFNYLYQYIENSYDVKVFLVNGKKFQQCFKVMLQSAVPENPVRAIYCKADTYREYELGYDAYFEESPRIQTSDNQLCISQIIMTLVRHKEDGTKDISSEYFEGPVKWYVKK